MSSERAFLSPDQARPEARIASPLARALEHAPSSVRDLSLLAKIDVRGDVGALETSPSALVHKEDEAIVLTSTRALVLGGAETRRRLREQGFRVTDATGALAGLEVEGEQVLRRLTELDLDALPAIGSVAHVQTIIVRDGERFRLFFPQEYGHYLAEVVLDAIEGLQ